MYTVPAKFNCGELAKQSVLAKRHIDSVIDGLFDFAERNDVPFATTDVAAAAICDFLNEFGFESLETIVNHTAVPHCGEGQRFLVGSYIQHIHEKSPERFESFTILVQGHLLANALTCPELIKSRGAREGGSISRNNQDS